MTSHTVPFTSSALRQLPWTVTPVWKMSRDYCSPNVVQDVYHNVSNCHSCAGNRMLLKHKRHLDLFLATWPLEFVVMDTLRPLSKTIKEYQCVVVTTDRYFKLTTAILTRQIKFTNVTHIFLAYSTLPIESLRNMCFNDSIAPYGILTHKLTDSDSQFTNKFLATLCSLIGTKQLTTTKNHLQTNGQVER